MLETSSFGARCVPFFCLNPYSIFFFSPPLPIIIFIFLTPLLLSKRDRCNCGIKKKATPPPPQSHHHHGPRTTTTTTSPPHPVKEREKKDKQHQNTVGNTTTVLFTFTFSIAGAFLYSVLLLHLSGLRFVWNRTRLLLAACILTTLGRPSFLLPPPFRLLRNARFQRRSRTRKKREKETKKKIEDPVSLIHRLIHCPQIHWSIYNRAGDYDSCIQ